MPVAKEHEKAFIDIWVRTAFLWQQVEHFQHYMSLGVPLISEQLKKDVASIYEKEVPVFDEAGKQLWHSSEGEKAQLEHEIESIRSAIDSASIVLAHSLLDAAATDYLKLTRHLDPAAWREMIMEKPIEGYVFKDLTPNFLNELQNKLFDAKERDIERRSFPGKVEELFRLCSSVLPTTKFCLRNAWNDDKFEKFDMAVLKRIDRLRHDIVHQNASLDIHQDVKSDLSFLKQLRSYLHRILNKRYKIEFGRTPVVNDSKAPE